MAERAEEPPFDCGDIGCNRRADWTYVGGDLYLCDFHGNADGRASADGWTRLAKADRD